MKLGLLAAKFTGIDNDAALFARYGIESYHFTKKTDGSRCGGRHFHSRDECTVIVYFYFFAFVGTFYRIEYNRYNFADESRAIIQNPSFYSSVFILNFGLGQFIVDVDFMYDGFLR